MAIIWQSGHSNSKFNSYLACTAIWDFVKDKVPEERRYAVAGYLFLNGLENMRAFVTVYPPFGTFAYPYIRVPPHARALINKMRAEIKSGNPEALEWQNLATLVELIK
ncbi:MAG: hypothetical protein QW318_07730 [Candidatus Caldarchaeum sp.]